MKSEPMTGNYYMIRIREKLDDTWAEWFDPMSLHRDGENTILFGCLPDQAALHGMLTKVNSLGLQLLAVSQEGHPDSTN
jgi:hypothetical protein